MRHINYFLLHHIQKRKEDDFLKSICTVIENLLPLFAKIDNNPSLLSSFPLNNNFDDYNSAFSSFDDIITYSYNRKLLLIKNSLEQFSSNSQLLNNYLSEMATCLFVFDKNVNIENIYENIYENISGYSSSDYLNFLSSSSYFTLFNLKGSNQSIHNSTHDKIKLLLEFETTFHSLCEPFIFYQQPNSYLPTGILKTPQKSLINTVLSYFYLISNNESYNLFNQLNTLYSTKTEKEISEFENKIFSNSNISYSYFLSNFYILGL